MCSLSLVLSMFVHSSDKFIFTATNVQRVLDGRQRASLVRPGSVEVEMDADGLVTKCRAQVLVFKSPEELAYEYSLVSVAKLVHQWDAFRKRVELTDYRRKVDVRNRRVVVENLESGRCYATTLDNCDCGSFRAQCEHRDYLSRYISDFTPQCKHVSWLRAVEATSSGTQCFWAIDANDPSMITIHVWPGADPLKHPGTGKVCEPGVITFWGRYPLGRLDELHHTAIARGWRFVKYEPYGVPLLHR